MARTNGTKKKTDDHALVVRVPKACWEFVTTQAKSEGLSLAGWLRRKLIKESKRA